MSPVIDGPEEVPFRLAVQEYDPAIPIGSLQEHPENPNLGDIGAISLSMDKHGFFGAVLVQRSTGHILAGNHRYRTAVIKGAATVPGFLIDCDDDEATELLLVDNRTTHLATFDEAKLVELLTRAAHSPRGLAGTGYSGDDLDDLIQQLQPPDLGDLGGGNGGGPSDEDLWPVLKFKVAPEARDRFYALTDDSEDSNDAGRFMYLLGVAGGPE